jgi:DNA-binding protein H-NS
MAKSYSQIQKEIETLQRAAEKLREKEVAEVVANIKQAIQAYDLTAADLGLAVTRRGRRAAPRRPARKTTGTANAVKYRDAAGNTWGGRGPRPQWLRDALGAGKTLEDFAV